MKYNTKNYDYLIVGTGFYGSIFAYEAAKRGKRVLVIDKRNHIGGNMYTYKKFGINIHKYGAHIFHTNNKEVWEYIQQFSEFNNYTNQVLANYKDKFYNLPFNMNTFYQMWGVKTPKEAFDKIEEQRSEASINKVPTNLEEQAISLIGVDIYKKLIKGYTEKQWGKKPNKLPPFIIRRLPVRFTFDNNYFNDKYQGVPINGYTTIFEKMLSNELIDIQLNTDFLLDKNCYIQEFPRIIYTGMIDAFHEFKYGELEYRSIKIENEVFDSDNVQGNAVINFTDSDVPYTRRMEWKHFDGKGMKGKSVLSKEYPQDWSPTKEAYYPLNDLKNSELFKKYKKESYKFKNVIFGGRLGNYQYYDMDQVIGLVLKEVDKEFKSKKN